uniref:Homocysteine S-methyltransferase YbgG n=1 Tax=Cacopsylla melanoneura TaxID=428564 RepID=A0A8D8YXA7_9HEMI
MSMKRVKLLDGSFTKQVSKHAVNDIKGHKLWSSVYLITEPEACIETHRDFIRAGVDIIESCCYQANQENLSTLGYSNQDILNNLKKSVELMNVAKQRENNDHIETAGCVGPYGTVLRDGSEYSGHYVDSMTEADLMDWHRPKIQCLVEAGVDYLALETIPAEKEALALVKLLREFPEQKAWLSFSCKDEYHTSHGEPLSSVVSSCLQANPTQIQAVGVNCIRPKHVSTLIRNIKQNHPTVQTIAYPNKGNEWDSVNMKWLETGTENEDMPLGR